MTELSIVKVVCHAKYLDNYEEREVFKSTDEDFQSHLTKKDWLKNLSVSPEDALIEYALKFFLQERDEVKELKFTISRKS